MIDSLCPGSKIFSLLFQSQGRPSPRIFHGSDRPCSGATTRQEKIPPALEVAKEVSYPKVKAPIILRKISRSYFPGSLPHPFQRF
jgi:hypothetical protein